MFNRLRTAFFAGLLAGVPLAVTVWLLVLLVKFLESAIHLVPRSLQPETIIGMNLPGLGIVLAFSLVIVVGIVGQSLVGRRLVFWYESLLQRVPLVSSVYSGVKQLLQQVFDSQKGFESVVLVQWPRNGVYALGFVTGHVLPENSIAKDMVHVFLPTTPNPTSGFYFMIERSRITETTLTVEDAFKMLMSAGIVSPSAPYIVQHGGAPELADSEDARQE